MLETLVESGAPRRFAAPRFLASLALHGSVIAVAVTLTRQPPAMPPVRPARNDLMFVATAPERAPLPATPRRPQTSGPATAVDEPADLLESHAPRYPPALARAGIEGRVELEYVVDTLGRAEPGSVHALVSTHPSFEAAAREAVLASRYRAARLNGRPARQLVRQTLSFRLAR